jgi:hypothetical protein
MFPKSCRGELRLRETTGRGVYGDSSCRPPRPCHGYPSGARLIRTRIGAWATLPISAICGTLGMSRRRRLDPGEKTRRAPNQDDSLGWRGKSMPASPSPRISRSTLGNRLERDMPALSRSAVRQPATHAACALALERETHAKQQGGSGSKSLVDPGTSTCVECPRTEFRSRVEVGEVPGAPTHTSDIPPDAVLLFRDVDL